MQVIGIDVGGTEIKAAIVDQAGRLTNKEIVQTPVKEGAKGILNTVHDIITNYLVHNPKINKVGIGSAGRIDHDSGQVIYATENLPGWTGIEIKKEIEKRHGVKVCVDNDVNVAAIGEQWHGAARNKKQFVLLTMGTGIGGAFVYEGRIVHGPTGSASEVGHMIIYPNGEQCNCGQSGCLEQYISGTALNRKAKEKEPSWDSYTLFKQYSDNHPIAIEIMEEFTFDLAIALINIHHFYDPEIIILGGGIGNTYNQWISSLESVIEQQSDRKIKLGQVLLGNEAGIIGAAKMALDNYL